MNKGFVSTLEAVIASSLFLLFLVNVLPTFAGTGGTEAYSSTQMQDILQSLDRAGELREPMVTHNVTKLHEMLDDYALPLNSAVSLLYINTSRGTFSGGSGSFTFQHEEEQEERTVLHLWIDQIDRLTVSVNEQQVASISTAGHRAINIEDETTQGQNTINFTAQNTVLDYTLDQYFTKRSRSLPQSGEITSVSHHISGINTTFSPTEIRVFLWE
ncbi:MAG: hypothetical protein SV186_05950 [Candidatus Nanohaloarchaea archaeon]|nr:hypothetical protein [Candidatus Nanohaloarchaea archaeon]